MSLHLYPTNKIELRVQIIRQTRVGGTDAGVDIGHTLKRFATGNVYHSIA